ncbi:10607_t:CDS:2, partial [Diversispora eburnea]
SYLKLLPPKIGNITGAEDLKRSLTWEVYCTTSVVYVTGCSVDIVLNCPAVRMSDLVAQGKLSLKRKSYEPEESDEPEHNKKRKNATESVYDNKMSQRWSPDHVKKFLKSRVKDSDFNETDIKNLEARSFDRDFLCLTEEKLTRKPGLYEFKPSTAEGIMELVEENYEKS